MKKYLFVFGLTILMAGSYSCKSKKDNAATETTTTTTPSTAPVVINDDDELERGVDQVTKDFPGVDADVDDGVITLTGTIDRDRYMTLKQALDALRPKQVVNNLKYN
ncbi:MAG: BON domain-containing protein [Chitinophagaceae bacterium]|nr:MAG: BON domain-containing protein [Chitinophagaceae bacterium]